MLGVLRAGAVHWGPPVEAITEAAAHATESAYSSYGPDEGMPELRAALQKKIEDENGLRGVGCPFPRHSQGSCVFLHVRQPAPCVLCPGELHK